MRSVADVIESNARHLAEKGPGLSYGFEVYVAARNADNTRVLLGGLGNSGVGLMWFTKSDKHEALVGYDDAPTQEETPL